MSTATSTTYDDFSAASLDERKWVPADFGTGPLLEPAAVTSLADGALTVDVPQFANADAEHQGLDNTKHLLFSTEAFPLPDEGVARFSVDLRSEVQDASGDYRHGFASFTLVDLDGVTNRVFAILCTRDRVLAEEELLPGHPELAPFTRVVEDPFFRARGGEAASDGFRRCCVEIDRGRAEVRYLVDDELLHVAAGLTGLPERVHMAMGLFTLLPLGEGEGSTHGQGGRATWRDPRYAVEA